MIVIALAGGVASGKSTILNVLHQNGAETIDADKIGHSLYNPGEPCVEKLAAIFGSEIVATDGSIDRKVLGPKVFQKPDEMKKLTDVVWPLMQEKIMAQIDDMRIRPTPPRIVVVEAAILVEAGWTNVADQVWIPWVPTEVQLQRLMTRNNFDEVRAKSIIGSQLSHADRVDKLKQAGPAFHVIDNSGSIESTERVVRNLIGDLE